MIQVNNNRLLHVAQDRHGGLPCYGMFHYLICIDYNNRTKFFKTRDTYEKATDSPHL
jgi:hypothetical protein